jgi:hypothetical protein
MKNKFLNHFINFLSVILGVYLAFYVNDEAKSAEDRKEAMALMQSMREDLAADIKVYEQYQIPTNRAYLEGIDSLLALLMANEKERIQEALPGVFQVENYTPSNSTYNSMKSSGKMRLIDDLPLRKQLSDFYDGLALECEMKNELQAEYFMDEVVNWLTLHSDLMEMKLLSEKEMIVFRNILLIYQSVVSQKINNYEMIVEDAKKLKIQLDALISQK